MALPQQIAGTTADKITQRVTLETPESSLPAEDEIRPAALWSDEDKERLLLIEQELKSLSEPAQAAAQYRRFKASVEAFELRLTAIDGLLKPEALTKHRAQFDKAQATRDAASIAALGRFDQDPLGKAVGNAAWRKLYEYAEKFSTDVYPGQPFPATGEDRVCLLCQQPYDEISADRMRRFKLFVEDTSQKEAIREESQLKELLRSVLELSIPTAQDLDLQFMELSAHEPSFEPIKAKLAVFIVDAATHKMTLLAALNGEASFDAVSALDSSAIIAANDFATPLEAKARQFDEATVNTAATDKLKIEHNELQGRRQLNASTTQLFCHASPTS